MERSIRGRLFRGRIAPVARNHRTDGWSSIGPQNNGERRKAVGRDGQYQRRSEVLKDLSPQDRGPPVTESRLQGRLTVNLRSARLRAVWSRGRHTPSRVRARVHHATTRESCQVLGALWTNWGRSTQAGSGPVRSLREIHRGPVEGLTANSRPPGSPQQRPCCRASSRLRRSGDVVPGPKLPWRRSWRCRRWWTAPVRVGAGAADEGTS